MAVAQAKGKRGGQQSGRSETRQGVLFWDKKREASPLWPRLIWTLVFAAAQPRFNAMSTHPAEPAELVSLNAWAFAGDSTAKNLEMRGPPGKLAACQSHPTSPRRPHLRHRKC